MKMKCLKFYLVLSQLVFSFQWKNLFKFSCSIETDDFLGIGTISFASEFFFWNVKVKSAQLE